MYGPVTTPIVPETKTYYKNVYACENVFLKSFFTLFLFPLFLGCANNYRLLGGALIEFNKTHFKQDGKFRQITDK